MHVRETSSLTTGGLRVLERSLETISTGVGEGEEGDDMVGG